MSVAVPDPARVAEIVRAARDASRTQPPAPAWLAGNDLRDLAPFLDHTLLRPEATRAEIAALADEGRALGVAAVCVHGAWAGLVRERLASSAVRTAVVVGFPHGAGRTAARVAEARLAVEDGAGELDMVMALGPAKAGAWGAVRDDIAAVVAAAGVPVKVIVEAAALTPEELAAACLVSVEAGAAFVKTSTGFHPAGGAREQDVRLMRLAVGDRAGVKASGGIRTAADARRMLLAGADRIGTSSAAAIVAG